MNNTELIIYQSEDGKTRIEARLEDETVWLTQAQLAELFQTTKQNVGQHLKNIFDEGELVDVSVVKNFFTTAADGKSYNTAYYSLDAIISVGYRVKSGVATRFRIWATQRLREYIVKGFTLNDERLKEAGGGNYFDELLARIRDIRSSEKVFWRKVLDIFATSVDYDPNSDAAMKFFQTVQNKMHWAAHGNTAAEVVYKRIDAQKPNLGLTNFKGAKPTKQETEIGKNYLTADELNILNRIVSAYLEFAELQALNRKAMHMGDWIGRLDDFLKMAGNEVLDHAGTVSHETMLKKATEEYDKYKTTHKNDLSQGEQDFIKHLDEAEKKAKLVSKKNRE